MNESGDFSLDISVMAEIWLVGGGMDGTDGFTDNMGVFHGGIGGQGGYVYKFGRIKLSKDKTYSVIIANVNEPSGTSFKYGTATFNSGQAGHTCMFGGVGGIITPSGAVLNPTNGKDGVLTPYGYVGSSGSGGACAASLNDMVKSTGLGEGGIGAGNSRMYVVKGINWETLKEQNPNIDAVNYGCGGGGNTYCFGLNDIDVKSHGMPGCVVIKYTELENDSDSSPECSIKFWNNNTDAASYNALLQEEVDALTEQLANEKSQNEKLKAQVEDLEKQIEQLGEQG